jgi:uncharacterized protein YvpB
VGLVGLFAILATLLTAAPASPATERVLNVPWAHQAHNLSCEAAALKMALSYYGISIDELRLIALMSRDARPARFDPRGRLVAWGDPAAGFVGNPDGHIQLYTGYGVYDQPVALAAMRAGANVLEAGSGLYGRPVTASEVYQAIVDGHPVVAWISNTYKQASLERYVAYDGATVRYTLTEHAVTVIGVKREAVLINDPWFGPAWHPKAQFEATYRTFAGMAVVVGSPNSSPVAGNYPIN